MLSRDSLQIDATGSEAKDPPIDNGITPTDDNPAPDTGVPSATGASAGTQPTRPPFGVGRYTVSKGDTMFSIARKLELNLAVLSSVNNISDPSSVKAGQTLLIPAQPGAVHVVGSGDTIQSIADRYQSKSELILEANRLDTSSRLEAGQLVLIPGTVQASAAAIKPLPPTVSKSVSTSASTVLGGISPLPAPKSAQAPSIAQVATATVSKLPLGGGGETLIWPVVGPISTLYSPSHRGLDIVANEGVPVKAALAGRVVGAAPADGPYGWYVIVDHGSAFTTVYAHLSNIRVKVGDTVDKNQIVGEVGSTGKSTGAHLHFELRQTNVPFDPRPYLQ